MAEEGTHYDNALAAISDFKQELAGSSRDPRGIEAANATASAAAAEALLAVRDVLLEIRDRLDSIEPRS